MSYSTVDKGIYQRLKINGIDFPIQKANLPNLPEILIQILQAEA